MSLAPTYNPKEYEDKIYQQWQDYGVGSPEVQQKTQIDKTSQSTTHSILMPPPNLTGDLHAGHAFGHYLQDTISRINRQKGTTNLWYPGVDHAGLQLEGVIDKLIKKGEFDELIRTELETLESKIKNTELEQIISSKDDLAKYLKQNHSDIWLKLAWSKVNLWRDNQKKQSSVLGDTPDYRRNLFTLDERATKMVMAAFEQYWKDGLIYKGSYLINWSVGLQTALSDVAGEIEFEERKDPFVTFEYRAEKFDLKTDPLHIPLLAKIHDYFDNNPLQVSTVRPETIFGDVALAIHPEVLEKKLKENNFDEMEISIIKHLIINKQIGIEFGIKSLNVKKIQLILSQEVDPNFGSGTLKITPASDTVDYNIFQQHIGGDFPQSIGRDGKLTEVCGEYAGLTVEQGRLAVIKTLAENGYIPVRENLWDKFEADYKSQFNHDKTYWINKTLAEAAQNLAGQDFDPKDYSYEEGIKRLKEIMGEAGQNLAIDWDYIHNVSICERSKTVIEPLISEEFFLSYEREFRHSLPVQDAGTKDIYKTYTNKNLLYEKYDLQDGLEHKNKELSHGIIYNPKIDKYLVFKEVSNPFGKYDFSLIGGKLEIGENPLEALKREFTEETGIETTEITRIQKLGRSIYGFVFQPDNYNTTHDDNLFYLEVDSQKDGFSADKCVTVWLTKEEILKSHISERDQNLFEQIESLKQNSPIEKLTQPSQITNLKQLGLEGIQETKYFSQDYQDRALNFLENIKDWCISRDLVWGHKIPVWYNLDVNPEKRFYSFKEIEDLTENSPLPMKVQTERPSEVGNWLQEEKILDTWFSSCLWPLTTLNFYDWWQGETEDNDFTKFYSTQEIITGGDIFYTWIVRMTVLGKYFTGKIPFQTVVITPTVRDEQGRKMSKSLGNGLDPIKAIESYSSDSLRLAMLSGMIPNRNFRLGGSIADKMCEKYRNFGNKLWNVARFLESKQ